MPFNFLELVPSYQNAGLRKKVRKRRTIVAQFLGDNYGFSHNDSNKEKAVIAARDAGIDSAAIALIGGDARIFKMAFEYLNDPHDERKTTKEMLIAAQQEHRRVQDKFFGIHCLMKDGIDAWDQILALKKEHEQAVVNPEIIIPPIVVAESAKDADENSLPNTSHDVGARPAETSIFTIAQSAAEFLPAAAQTFANIIPRILDEIKDRDKRITLLSGQCQSLNQQAERLLADLQEAHSRAQQWEKFAIEVDEQKNVAQAKTLLELAEAVAVESERGMEVLRSVNKYLEECAARERTQARMEIINGFPEKVLAGNMEGHEFVYEESFLCDLRRFSKEDQQKVRYALQKLSEHGETYPSLKTHIINDDWIDCLPKGSSSSRASDELRFFWKYQDGKIHLYRLGRKGEQWLQNSEA